MKFDRRVVIVTEAAKGIGLRIARAFGREGAIAECVLFLASDAAGYVTGAVLDANGGLVMM